MFKLNVIGPLNLTKIFALSDDVSQWAATQKVLWPPAPPGVVAADCHEYMSFFSFNWILGKQNN